MEANDGLQGRGKVSATPRPRALAWKALAWKALAWKALAWKAFAVLALCSAATLALAGCSDRKALQRAFRPQLVNEKDPSLMTIDRLKEAIAEYATEAEAKKYAEVAELGLDVSAKLGTYRITLADRYIAKRMFKDAYDVLVLAAQAYPDDWRIYYNAGLSAAYVAKSMDIKGAAGTAEKDRWLSISESCYRRALGIKPRSSEALYGAAVLYAFELGRPADAAALLVTLLGIETKNVDAMLLLGRCYAELGKTDEAINLYETAAKVTVVPEKRKAAEENRAKLLGESGGGKSGK